MPYQIDPAHTADAADLSRLILAALRTSNARDYPAAVIERVESSFTPAAVAVLIGQRQVFVARMAGRIVGTASLDGAVVRSVFVDPAYQQAGVGRRLMAHVMEVAGVAGVKVLAVPSSVTAQPFYATLGFEVVREHCYEGERTIVMQRALTLESK
ncbi:MAG: GNAT family N-acetyltransferase [Pseudomonas sp.]|uniref:GNAT family N-acetyltransferase n=1 Tax=Pseudomonas sp. TaxID=306 RepID=UPI0033910206